MNHDEIVTMLQIMSAYDSRKIDGPSIAAWKEAAARARWASRDALNAIHEHYAKSTAWLMPGHVTELIRASKRHPAPASEVLAIEKAPPASAEMRAKVLAEVRALADSKRVDQ